VYHYPHFHSYFHRPFTILCRALIEFTTRMNRNFALFYLFAFRCSSHCILSLFSLVCLLSLLFSIARLTCFFFVAILFIFFLSRYFLSLLLQLSSWCSRYFFLVVTLLLIFIAVFSWFSLYIFVVAIMLNFFVAIQSRCYTLHLLLSLFTFSLLYFTILI